VKPMKVNCKVVPPEGTLREYFPSTPVKVPTEVPWTTTVTPDIGCPPASLTTPVTDCWAIRLRLANSNKTNNALRLSIVLGFRIKH